MPLTPAQKSSAFRARRAAKIARMEAALQEIAVTNWSITVAAIVAIQDIANEALSPFNGEE